MRIVWQHYSTSPLMTQSRGKNDTLNVHLNVLCIHMKLHVIYKLKVRQYCTVYSTYVGRRHAK